MPWVRLDSFTNSFEYQSSVQLKKRVLQSVNDVRQRKKFGAERMGNVTRLRLGVARMRRELLLFQTSAAGEPQGERDFGRIQP